MTVKAGSRRRVDNRVLVDTVVPVQVVKIAGLPEMIDSQRHHHMPANTAEPGQSRRVAVGDRDDRGIRSQSAK